MQGAPIKNRILFNFYVLRNLRLRRSFFAKNVKILVKKFLEKKQDKGYQGDFSDFQRKIAKKITLGDHGDPLTLRNATPAEGTSYATASDPQTRYKKAAGRQHTRVPRFPRTHILQKYTIVDNKLGPNI
jgi:hypothetical protein